MTFGATSETSGSGVRLVGFKFLPVILGKLLNFSVFQSSPLLISSNNNIFFFGFP